MWSRLYNLQTYFIRFHIKILKIHNWNGCQVIAILIPALQIEVEIYLFPTKTLTIHIWNGFHPILIQIAIIRMQNNKEQELVLQQITYAGVEKNEKK